MNTPVTTFTPEQLARWGLLHQVEREACIDQLLHEVRPPDANQLKTLQKQWLHAHGMPNQKALHGWLKQQGLNEKSWTERITRSWLWQQWCQEHFKDQITSYYLKRKPLLDHVSYSLLRVRENTLANELYLRIKEGESTFEQVASEYSVGPERKSGGQLGPVPMQQPHPVLARLLEISQPGQLWPPKPLDNWWIVVRLNQIHTTELDAKTAERLALELGEKHVEEILVLSKPITNSH